MGLTKKELREIEELERLGKEADEKVLKGEIKGVVEPAGRLKLVKRDNLHKKKQLVKNP